mmetsp:Transcript_54270/g.149557  ORF Transcript_54270/g.149557 Transcript_54270/m.149557 type:complete len:89 (+) Transcript_54270:623-889(+)
MQLMPTKLPHGRPMIEEKGLAQRPLPLMLQRLLRSRLAVRTALTFHLKGKPSLPCGSSAVAHALHLWARGRHGSGACPCHLARTWASI